MEKNKTRFVRALINYADAGKSGMVRLPRGMAGLLIAVADYFEEHDEIPEEISGCNWCHDLGDHLVDAFEEFRNDPKYEALRANYLAVTEGRCRIPSLVDVRGGFDHGHVTFHLAKVMGEVTKEIHGGDWLAADLEARFDAQKTVLAEVWQTFIRRCYRRGLYDRIKDEEHRGNSGEFGKTTLLTYAMAGRIMFTIQREGCGITFVADDSDASGCRSGMNFPTDGLPFTTLVEMIEDVVTNWDIDKLVPDEKVGIG